MPDISEDLRRIKEAKYGEEVRNSIHDSIRDINEVVDDNVPTVTELTNQAKSYRDDAAAQATSAANQVTLAKQEVVNARNAGAEQVRLAKQEVVNARNAGAEQVALAKEQVNLAKQEANRAETAEDNAEEWYNKAKTMAESFPGGLRPLGTITFARLPSAKSSSPGDLYNVSDAFTTTKDFMQGSGVSYPAGSNVYLTVSKKWDVLTGVYSEEALLTMDEL